MSSPRKKQRTAHDHALRSLGPAPIPPPEEKKAKPKKIDRFTPTFIEQAKPVEHFLNFSINAL